MALTPSLVLFFLTLFAADVHSVKVLDVLKGSTAVLTPDDVETSIISVTWKHGEDLAAEWFGGSPTFYHGFNDRCSLNTETGELTINDVRLEHSGVYTPEINNRILTNIRLQVLSPVPKPSIISNCNSEQTLCTLACVFDRTDDLGDVQVFWILDDSSVKEGSRLSVTKETKEKTFICRLKNPVSSESSNKLKNPLLPNKALIISLAVLFTFIILISLGVLVYLHIKKRRLQRKLQRLQAELQRLQAAQDNLPQDVHTDGYELVVAGRSRMISPINNFGVETGGRPETNLLRLFEHLVQMTPGHLPGEVDRPFSHGRGLREVPGHTGETLSLEWTNISVSPSGAGGSGQEREVCGTLLPASSREIIYTFS